MQLLENADTVRSSPRSPEQASPCEGGGLQGSTIMIVAWPEYGHVVTLLALAKELRSHGSRVVFAGARPLEKAMAGVGYEFANLSGARAPGVPTLFDFLPNRAAFDSAVSWFISVFQSVLTEHRPSLILFDSLYSAFTSLASAAKIRWALYETDLPREYDAGVPPPHTMLNPGPSTSLRIREEWGASLLEITGARSAVDVYPERGYAWGTAYFPAVLTRELQKRLGTSVPFNFDTLYAPVARAPRMVFCPPRFDFQRTNPEGLSWVGPCIDFDRKEPDFPWHALPRGCRFAYCSLGTQSNRQPKAAAVLQTVVDVFSARSDYFLVLACGASYRERLSIVSDRVLVVERAPQLALLRKASLALIHGGFNSVKECAALGVPVVALPLGYDQPRNAALIEHHGLGVGLDTAALTADQLDAAVTHVATSSQVAAACAAMKAQFDDWHGRQRAVGFVEEQLAAGPV